MVTVPISRSGAATPEASAPAFQPVALPPTSPAPIAETELEITDLLVVGALVAGGVLMVSGRRREGLAVAAAGTALALLEEQEMVAQWWQTLPDYLNRAQDFLDRVERYLDEASTQGHRIQSILRRSNGV
jgi:hypothetical protein